MAFEEQIPDTVKPRAAVLLDVPAEKCRQRLLVRAAMAIEGRDDDAAGTIDHRLDLFEEDLTPVIECYQQWGLLIRVDDVADRRVVTERSLDRRGTP